MLVIASRCCSQTVGRGNGAPGVHRFENALAIEAFDVRAAERDVHRAMVGTGEDAQLVAGAAAAINTMYCVNAPSMAQLAVAEFFGMLRLEPGGRCSHSLTMFLDGN